MVRTTAPTRADLLPYLGFGLLDQESVRSEKDRLTATYSDAHGVVYGVDWSPGDCALTSRWRGTDLGTFRGADLQQAFFSSWLCVQATWDDTRMVDLANEIMHMGNIYFVFSRLSYLYYPAGLLVALRQPIPESHLSAWEAFKETLDPPGAPEPRLGLDHAMSGKILHQPEHGSAWTEPLLVADLTVPLVGLTQAAARCVAAGIIPNGKPHRLVVSPFQSRLWQSGDAATNRGRFMVMTDDEADRESTG